MALGFIKKIFSFGKKEVEVVQEKTADAAPVTPALEAPVVETPVVETPVVETPVIDAPVIDVPFAEAPVAEPLPTEPPAPAEPEAPEPEAAPEAPVVEEIEAAAFEDEMPVADVPAAETVEIQPADDIAEEPAIEIASPAADEPEEVAPEPVAETPVLAPEEPIVEPLPAPPVDLPPDIVVTNEAPAVIAEPTPSVVEPEVTPDVEPVAPEVEISAQEPEPEPAPVPAKLPPKKVTVSRTVEAREEEIAAPSAPEPKVSWFQRLRKGLSRSSQQLGDSIGGIFTKRKLDEDTLQDLEDVLIQADLGLETAMRITDALSQGRYGKDIATDEVQAIMAAEIEKVLTPVAKPLELDLSHKPHVILVVGVNGTGKTTTIGKLAAKLTAGGLKVMLAAGDTFRAAAIEQLHIWGERTGSPVVSSKLGADAAGLAYDAWEKAKAAGSDVLIIDTAGRLQNKAELMEELAKIVRVLGKNDPEAPHTVLQTLDATTGQNALNQVEIFKNIAGVNGLVMTKLDGTARGGILVAISARHKLPVYFIGVGEQVDDLEPFAAKDFARAIAGVA